MPTLSVHVDEELSERVRLTAKMRRIPVSRLLKEMIAREVDLSNVRVIDIMGFAGGTGEIDPEEKVLDPWSEDDSLYK